MSFTYQPSAGTNDDITRVRFHTGQTLEAESLITDEDILMAIAEEGSWQAAVIECLNLIISQLSRPDFKADWLTVSTASARSGFVALLAEKKRKFGLGKGPSVKAVHVTRSDALPTDEGL